MMPIGPLMKEHRLIEKMLRLMEREVGRMAREKNADARFIETAVDFIRTYADRCHHGKEEDILFKRLATKKLSADERRMMQELIDDHKLGRKAVARLVSAKDAYERGGSTAISGIITEMRWLADFYPKHIEKEDKHFFLPVMDYLSDSEKEAMLKEMAEFDSAFIHNKYAEVVQNLSKK